MVKRCIGIDIGCSYLQAVQIAHVEEGLRIEKVFSCQHRRSTDSLSDILKSLLRQHGFDSRAAVATALPQDAVFYRNLQTDAAGLEQMRQHNSSAFEQYFPIPIGQIVAQPHSYRQLSEDRYSVLAAAVSRELVRQRCGLLAEAKLHPDLADAAIFAIRAAVAVNHPEVTAGRAIIAYVDDSHLTLAVTENNNILIVRNLRLVYQSDGSIGSPENQVAQILSREAAISWQKIFHCEIEQDSRFYLATGGGVSAGLKAALEEKLPCRIIRIDPYTKVGRSPDCQANGAICLAEGLALRVLAPEKGEGVNFLEADDTAAEPALNLRKELRIFTVLAVAIAALLLVGLRARLFYMERNYARLKNQITEVFHAALPDEKTIVNPLAQLEQRIQSLQKDYQLFAVFHPTSLAPLNVLQKITTSMPPQGAFKVDDLLVTPSSVRISGTCNSFESVYQWQEVLQKVPGFALVDVDAQREPKSGAVSFTILVSSGKATGTVDTPSEAVATQ
jgi:Tfp pilus assembly PilM family ATPase/Tfp pilus assembly protein PilN